MLFSSWSFLLVFLPVSLGSYFILPAKLRTAFLLAVSLLFYAWGQPEHLLIMLAVIGLNYSAGWAIEVWRKYDKTLILFAVTANLGILCWYKYADFVVLSINSVLHTELDLLNNALPIGISFYIFQALSYTIDVYRKTVPVQKNILKLALYVSLFPQLIAGPIVRYRDIMGDISNRSLCIDDVVVGIRRFILGLAKKVVIADSMGEIADAIFAAAPGSIGWETAWLGAISYSLQIYFDFSGYSDMAIGLGRIFGFHFAENFNYPYISSSVTEFWRRWHISLSLWFRDYVYLPLGGSRCSALKTSCNLVIVFFLTGLWHGANWTFVVWGLWHALFLLMEKRLWLREKSIKQAMTAIDKHSVRPLFGRVYTIAAVILGWVIFRADTLNYGIEYIGAMFGLVEKDEICFGIEYYVNNKLLLVGAIGCVLSYPWKYSLLPGENDCFVCMLSKDLVILGVFSLALMFMAAGTYNPFIYFRF